VIDSAPISIQAANEPHERDVECFADPQECFHRNRAARFDLLPVASGKSVRNHIFLRKSLPLANLANTSAQSAKESGLIHAQFLTTNEQKHHEQNSCAALVRSYRNPLIR